MFIYWLVLFILCLVEVSDIAFCHLYIDHVSRLQSCRCYRNYSGSLNGKTAVNTKGGGT